MTQDSTLVILAAGMGSRFGGLKQVVPMGPNGESIMDYSIHDAKHAGFKRVVFVIREFMDPAFRERINARWEGRIETAYAFQELDTELTGTVPADREKPWGTGHALLCARAELDGPFAVINADDYYGPHAFTQLNAFLQNDPLPNAHAMVGYCLSQTLSEAGTVCRGVCQVGGESRLVSIAEHTDIGKQSDGVLRGLAPDGTPTELHEQTCVSMNCWGFKPAFISQLAARFDAFFAAGPGLKQEFYLPAAVDDLMHCGEVTVQVLETRDPWFGVTYKEDQALAQAHIQALIQQGVYPERL
ncbi:MAG: NTP transferase domain-containing protein [Phycisphaerae bacterium]|nr:NTP transferase domain-containing protein [Phycisphaerae bacterium]